MNDFLAKTTRGFLAPILEYLEDDDVSEIMINQYDDIYVEKRGKLIKTDAAFEDDEQMMAAVRNIAQFVGRRIDAESPIMDARLPDGSRIHVVIPPCSRRGITMTIRKFARENLSIKDLVRFGSLSVDCAKFLNLCVTMAKNTVVSGGTSSGKTTLLNIVSALIPEKQRIVVIEDSSELQLQQEHVVNLETQTANIHGRGAVSIRDLLKSSLRLRPDRIVIGEIRSGEAMDLLQAMNTGHSGSMSTVHANNPRGALARLETLALMNEIEIPLTAVRSQVASAMDIIIQAARLRDGSRKVTHITEVVGLDSHGRYITEDLFVYRIEKTLEDGTIEGRHVATGKKPSFLADAQAQGYNIDPALFEPSNSDT